MPFTPYHLGPALLIGLLCLRWLDFPTFLVANVLIDIRAALVFGGVVDGRLHGPLHTLLGATVVAVVLTVVVLPLRSWVDPVLDWLRIPQSTDSLRILAAALVGSWLHVLLDAPLYTDHQPFAPISTANPALGTVGTVTVYGACVVAGVLGLGLYTVSLSKLVALPGADPS